MFECQDDISDKENIYNIDTNMTFIMSYDR